MVHEVSPTSTISVCVCQWLLIGPNWLKLSNMTEQLFPDSFLQEILFKGQEVIMLPPGAYLLIENVCSILNFFLAKSFIKF